MKMISRIYPVYLKQFINRNTHANVNICYRKVMTGGGKNNPKLLANKGKHTLTDTNTYSTEEDA